MKQREFLEHPEVKSGLKKLDDVIHKIKGKRFSDVLDKKGNQYINFVQEGGGVLGVALVGFTYALESAGLRFWRLAGTSAGAINTILLASIGSKAELKSDVIIKDLLDVNLLDFADGHSVVKRFLRRFNKNSNFPAFIGRFLLYFMAGWLLLLISNLFIRNYYLTYISMLWTVFVFLVALLFFYLWRRFTGNGFGFCKGTVFQQWLTALLAREGVHSVADLDAKATLDHIQAGLLCDDLQNQPLRSDITLIASNITLEVKAELPQDLALYAISPKNMPAADLVRASMSIPYFFEAFKITPEENSETQYFVDGGIISNFPMSTFHNPAIRTPRLPNIGVRLKEDKILSSELGFFKNPISYFMRIFNTVRQHADKDFLQKNKFYAPYVYDIDVEGFNWLNFGMKEEEKIALFLRGLEKGIYFLEQFNWETYKAERIQLSDLLDNT